MAGTTSARPTVEDDLSGVPEADQGGSARAGAARDRKGCGACAARAQEHGEKEWRSMIRAEDDSKRRGDKRA
jgi:hypothetical protein